MSEPIAVCIEDCNVVTDAPKYVRCVAVPAGTPGLALAASGEVRWQGGDPVACTLGVSDDDYLILHRTAGAPPVTLQRAGRTFEVPCEEPVKILDQDRIDIGTRHLRIHIHGRADAVLAPTALVPPADSPGQSEDAAAAESELRASMLRHELKLRELRETLEEIELRDNPPRIAPIRPSSSDPSHPAAEPERAALDDLKTRTWPEWPDIRVREHPPSMEFEKPQPKKKPRPADDKETKGGRH
jgi:hypothetical protein